MDCVMIALDTSTKDTGYSIWKNAKLSAYASINLDKCQNAEKRLDLMIQKIYELIDKEKPVIVVTELTVVSRNAQAQRTLTLLLGAIKGKCIADDIFYHSFRPTEWRSLVGGKSGKREALKKWSIEEVNKRFNLEIYNDDISDSILIGQAYINMFLNNDELEDEEE